MSSLPYPLQCLLFIVAPLMPLLDGLTAAALTVLLPDCFLVLLYKLSSMPQMFSSCCHTQPLPLLLL